MAVVKFKFKAKGTVRSLKAGRSSTIVGIAAEHLSAKRLADMGFIAGARVKMVRGGNPCIVGIGGTFVGLGAANQSCVLVEPEPVGGLESLTAPVLP